MTTAGRRTPPPPPGSERRKHDRFELMAQIELRRDDEVFVLPVRDVSAGGILVGLGAEEVGAVGRGDRVDVFLEVEGAHGQVIEVRSAAEVVRVDHGGGSRSPSVGLMWVCADAEMPLALARLLRYLDTQTD